MASSSTPPNVDVEIGKMLLKINSNTVASCERGKKLSTCLIINCNVAPTGGKLPSLLERQRVRGPPQSAKGKTGKPAREAGKTLTDHMRKEQEAKI